MKKCVGLLLAGLVVVASAASSVAGGALSFWTAGAVANTRSGVEQRGCPTRSDV